MSKIPSGLTGAAMRARMEDKATIKQIGGLYVGGITSVDYTGGDDSSSGSTSAKQTEELPPFNRGYPLISNGAGAIPSFQPLGSDAIVNNSVVQDSLGVGSVISLRSSTPCKRLAITATSVNHDSISFIFVNRDGEEAING